MKTCSCCGITKEKNEFQGRKASKDGLTASCRDCLKERDAKRYLHEREARSMRHKEYMKTDAGKASHAKSVEAWIDQNKVRRAAHVILGNAVKYGKVQKQPCWVCGTNAEAHHPDYSRPLDVVWLCSSHHRETHNLISKDAT